MMYMVVGHVNMDVDGGVKTVQLPTFFLDSDIQGITDAEHAKGIAISMVKSITTVPHETFFCVLEHTPQH
jgi:hypothetical protein